MDKILSKIMCKIFGKIMDKIFDTIVDMIFDKIMDKIFEKIMDKILCKFMDKILDKIMGKIMGKILDKIMDKTKVLQSHGQYHRYSETRPKVKLDKIKDLLCDSFPVDNAWLDEFKNLEQNCSVHQVCI